MPSLTSNPAGAGREAGVGAAAAGWAARGGRREPCPRPPPVLGSAWQGELPAPPLRLSSVPGRRLDAGVAGLQRRVGNLDSRSRDAGSQNRADFWERVKAVGSCLPLGFVSTFSCASDRSSRFCPQL